jgi:ABC-type glycerol-3-phosphate transport system substrate-binding protein
MLAGLATGLSVIRPAAAETIELRLLHYMDETGNRAVLREILDRFEQANPGIKVQDFATPTEHVVPDAQAAVAARRPYDVAQVLTRLAIGARAVTNARPFSEAPDGGKFMEQFTPNLRGIGQFEGEYFLSPHSLGTPLLYHNKDIMKQAGLDPEKPPRTVQEMQEMARQVKQRTDAFGAYILTGGLDLGPQTLMRLAGSKYLEGNRAVFDSPEGIAAMQFWQDLAKEDLLPKVSDRDAANIFGAGKLAFYLSTSARLAGITRGAKGKFDLGVAPVPAWEDVPVQVPNSGSGMMVTAQQPERIAAAFKLVAFLAQPEITNHWSRSTGYMPVANDPLADPETQAFIADNPSYGVLVAQMRNTVATALWPGDRVVEGQTVVANLVTDLWEDKGTAAELVPQAAAEVTRILEESTLN